jgi:hypothetical protein
MTAANGPFELTQILTDARVGLLAKAVNELLGPEFVTAPHHLGRNLEHYGATWVRPPG